MGRTAKIFFCCYAIIIAAGAGIFYAASAGASGVGINLNVTAGGPICGNGVIDSGETCDSGSANGSCPAACSASCHLNDCGTLIIPPSVTPPGQTTTPTSTPAALAITGLAAGNIKVTGATVSWQSSNPAACQIKWGINTDYSSGAASEVSYLTSHSTQISGLSAETSYHYVVDCVDVAGSTAASGDRIFRTLSGTDTLPPANVSGLRTSSGNGTSTLFWRNPADPDFSGVIIRRSSAYYPGLTQGTEVYDGQGSLLGGEMTFSDSGLTNDTVYYYTVFTYDLNHNISSGVGIAAKPSAQIQTEPQIIPPPPTELPGGLASDLFFSDFNFSQQGKLLQVIAGDSVMAQPDLQLSIVLPQAKILPQTKKMVLNLSFGGKITAYLFSFDEAQSAYVTTLPPLSESGKYFVSIIALDGDNQSLKAISGSIEYRAANVNILPSVPAAVNATIDSTVNAVKNISQAVNSSPVVQAISQAAATPAGQSAAAATVAVSFATTAVSIPLLNWWVLLQFLFTQPLRLLWFRKGWGTVYNSITKKPIDLALVRLYDAKTGRLITSRVTDSNGRYIFLVNQGEYLIKVEKAGYEYPSELLKRARDDGSYLDLYYGEKIVISGDDRSAIIANIALDQLDIKLTDKQVLQKFSRARLSQSLSYLGPTLAIVYFFFYPSIFSFGLVVVHFLMMFLFRRLAGRKHKKHWGVVFGPDGKKPVNRAVTRVFSSEYGRMLEFYVTDDQGRYDFLVGNNKYYVTADKPGFGTAQTPVIDLTGTKQTDLAIAQDLVLQPEKSPDEAEAEPQSPAAPPPAVPAQPDGAANNTGPDNAAAPAPEPLPPLSHIDIGSIDEMREQMKQQAAPTQPEAKAENQSGEAEKQ